MSKPNVADGMPSRAGLPHDLADPVIRAQGASSGESIRVTRKLKSNQFLPGFENPVFRLNLFEHRARHFQNPVSA